jgi:hypothetical protein
VLLVAGIAASGLTLIAWTQTWFVVTLVPDELGGDDIAIAGDVAGGGLAALGLAGLALVGALAIAGPVFRVVLGALESLIGITVLLSVIAALADPVRVSGPAVTEATGVSGAESVTRLVQSVAISPWPWIAVVLGFATLAVGAAIIATSRRWPGSPGKYQAVRLSAEDANATHTAESPIEPDSVADWDSLSDGSDPTSR